LETSVAYPNSSSTSSAAYLAASETVTSVKVAASMNAEQKREEGKVRTVSLNPK